MGALRSKGRRDATRTKPLDTLLSYEETGNRASLVLMPSTVWIHNRSRCSVYGGRSRGETTSVSTR